MSDPVLILILLASFFAAMAAARFLKTVDSGFGRAARGPVIAGILVGLVLLFAGGIPAVATPLVAALLLTIAAVWVRHTGDESEAADGMILGSLTGASAAVPLALFSGAHELRWFSQLVLSGATAGYGVTYAAFHVADRARQIAIDTMTAAAAVLAAYVPIILARHASDRDIGVAVAAAIPVITVAIVFRQWPDMRAELAHEAALGFMSDADVATTAHPLRRLGRAGWIDPHAHREFVRLAIRIALRKRRQRNRADEVARLHQLEIIKLRMHLQEMTAIDRASLKAAESMGTPSDKMQP
jgi:hypothetical protein